MSDELTSLESLATDNRSLLVRLSPISQAVLFYAMGFWANKNNWYSSNPMDEITDVQWDTIQSYVDGLLYEVKKPMIGMIFPFVTESPPPNVLTCDGGEYLREEYPELYSILDSAFIVDADHFRVPDLRGRTVIGAGSGSGLSSRSVAAIGGEENHQLTEGELASHTHTMELTTGILVVAPGEVAADVTVPLISDYTGSTGGNEEHNNMQPFFALNYGILAS